VKDGFLEPNHVWVGTYSSHLQSFIDQLSPPPSSSAPLELSLSGEYFTDIPLVLPSNFALHFTGLFDVSLINLTKGTEKYPAMVLLKGSHTNVSGGLFAASQGLQAISVNGGKHCRISSVTATTSTVSDMAAIGIHENAAYTNIGFCNVSGGARGMWSLGSSRSFIHQNNVHDCGLHAVDFDAYTTHSVVVANTCNSNSGEGIFVEETSNGNVVFKNTCEDNTGHGINVYTLTVGPVTNNTIVGNTVNRNGKYGIRASGIGNKATQNTGMSHISKNNIFIGNTASNNHLGSWASGGPTDTSGDFWADNVPPTDFSATCPTCNSNSPPADVLAAAQATLYTNSIPEGYMSTFNAIVANYITAPSSSALEASGPGSSDSQALSGADISSVAVSCVAALALVLLAALAVHSARKRTESRPETEVVQSVVAM
jgi:parallel beta-helix repeat protein